MKNLTHDKDGKLCGAKTAFWVITIACIVKMFMQDEPDYAGLALMISPFAATYFGRSHTKAQK